MEKIAKLSMSGMVSEDDNGKPAPFEEWRFLV